MALCSILVFQGGMYAPDQPDSLHKINANSGYSNLV